MEKWTPCPFCKSMVFVPRDGFDGQILVCPYCSLDLVLSWDYAGGPPILTRKGKHSE